MEREEHEQRSGAERLHGPVCFHSSYRGGAAREEGRWQRKQGPNHKFLYILLKMSGAYLKEKNVEHVSLKGFKQEG